MIEPIDFSESGNEYLSSDLKQQVLAFSLLWAIVGFAASAWLFLGKKVGPSSHILDRRQAEGRVVESASRGRSSDRHSDGFSSQVPTVRPYIAPGAKEKKKWGHLVKLEAGKNAPAPSLPVAAVKASTPEPVKVAASTEVKKAPAPTLPARRVATRPEKRPAQVAKENPSRLLYPVTNSRPVRSNLTAVTRKVERSMIKMANLDGLYRVGFVVDSSGKALISDAFLNDGSISRVMVNGAFVRAEVLQRDPEYGMALIQLPPGSYSDTAPLAPGPPTRGEELLAFAPSSSRCLPTTVRAGIGFGQAGFLVEGNLGANTWGTPLFNDRGELVGCNFASLPSFPGSGVHLAADSSAIYRLLRGYDSSNSSSYSSTVGEAYSRLTSLAGESKDKDGVRKGRILAKVGVSQFFIGMSTEEARKWVSSPVRRSVASGVENWTSPAPPLELVFVNDRLVAVATDFTGFSTMTGLSMGARIDSSLLKRSFERYLLVDGLALTPGLDILLDRDGKARQFVVRPEL